MRNNGHTISNPVESLGLRDSNAINIDHFNCNPIFESDSSDYNVQLGVLEACMSASSEDDNESVISCDLLNDVSQTNVQDEINMLLQRMYEDQYYEHPTRKRKKIQVEEKADAISSSKEDDRVTQKDGIDEYELLLNHMGDNRYCQVIEQNSDQCTRTDKKNVVCQNRTHKICTHPGCKNQARNGAVCAKHGAKVTRKPCSHEGCTNHAKSGGVCVRHGAKRPVCQHKGCSTYAVKGGVCVRHGAKIKICMHEGCTAQARNGQVCVKHGAVCRNQAHKICTHPGRKNQARNRTVCAKHGAKVTRKPCSHEGCTNHAKSGGVCIRHGAKRPVCQHKGCSTYAVKGGVCTRHGAKIKICTHEGRATRARNGQVCVKHGAKVNRKISSHSVFDNNARNGGVYIKHGAGPIRKR